MKPIKSFLILAILVIPGLAAAQGYYGGGGPAYYGPAPLPGGFHNRQGRLDIGFSLGIGGMNDNGSRIDCSGCSENPATAEADFHIGGFVGPRVALMLELQGNVQQVALDPTQDVTLEQTLFMGAVQFWVLPQLWIKGGIGGAHLDVVDNVAGIAYSPTDNGLGLLAGAGFELLSARNFALDLQLRLTRGQYSSGDNINSGTIGLGLNWY